MPIMNKYTKMLLSLLLLPVLVLTLAAPVQAHGPQKETEPPMEQLHIETAADFLNFAEDCRLDSFSRNLEVHLDKDLDLTDREFEGVPIFYGVFDGHDHKITGLSLTRAGSDLGLFRYVEKDAIVRNLHVEGTVAPEGSRQKVGGLVGSNAGLIENCSFKGELNAQDFVGGIAGANRVPGIIENCQVSGNIHGDHFVGGIAGSNDGVVRSCENSATVNTTARENTVEITSITLDTITGTESVNTVTDVGGIVGTSAGVVRDCVNRANVGYPHMGYNIGGIAGSQKGFLTGCENRGAIDGRKEAGGIVGQLEPISKVEFTVDTLQILKGQLASTSAAVSRVSANAQEGTASIAGGIAGLRDETQTAKEALDVMLPGGKEPFPPDLDSFQAARTALTESMKNMRSLTGQLAQDTEDTSTQLAGDLRSLAGRVQAMGATISNAEEHLGGTITDISDLDTEEEMDGEISHCRNFGSVSADINAGGVVGSMAFENDFDPEDDLQALGDPSLNFDSEVRAVVYACENHGNVTAKKNNAGGIAGWVSLGLVKDCSSTGHLDTETARYVGGIAGLSGGYIRNCSVKSLLSGTRYVGGIAGQGSVVTDCLALTYIMEADERSGAILGGYTDPKNEDITEPLKNNVYLLFGDDPGAIDGVSYDGKAQGLGLSRFLVRENLPRSFLKATLTFRFEDGTETQVEVPIGSALNRNQVPALPDKNGFSGVWEGLENSNTSEVYFDMAFEPVYEPHRMTIRSQLAREDGRGILLAEGRFPDMEDIELTALDTLPVPQKGTAVEGWELPVFAPQGETVVHYACPDAAAKERTQVMVRRADGTWELQPATLSGSYLVFPVKSDDTAICAVILPDYSWVRYVLLGTAALALVAVVILVKQKNKKKKK